MKIKINIDYKINLEKTNKDIEKQNLFLAEKGLPKNDLITDIDDHYADLTLNYIQSSIRMKYEKGLENQFRRINNRIISKIDEAIESKTYEIELEESEKDFIKKSFETSVFPVEMTKYICIFEDEFIEKFKEAKIETPATTEQKQ